MNSEENSKNNEIFFKRLDSQLTAFFGMTESDISDQELNYSFPILTELTAIEEQYEVSQKIGQGGMKAVYKAKERKTNRYVAMAKMSSVSTREGIEYFLREARLTSSLQHPNIVTVHSIGLDEDANPYFTMELLRGKTLAEVLKESYLDIPAGSKEARDKLVNIFSKICDAIAYAHSKQIIHLDIKPQNINVGKYGEVVVMDWGLAKILTDDEDFVMPDELDPNELNHATLQGQIKGTPGFMAPEQTMSYGSKDVRSDVYALGAILYACLTGEPPIAKGSVDEMLEKTQKGEIRALNDVLEVDKVSPGLEALVMKALAVNPDDRYQTIAALKNDLDKYSRGFATSAEDASFIKQLVLLLKRHKKIVSVALLGIVGLGCILAYSFHHIQRERNIAIDSQRQAERNLALLVEEKGVSSTLRKNVDGLIFEVLHSEDFSSAKRKIHLLDEAISRESVREKLDALRKRKAILHFVIQEFDEALVSLEACSHKNARGLYYKLAKKGAKLKGAADSLSDDGLATILSQMGSNYADVIFSMYENHMRFRRSKKATPKGYIKLATVMLNMNNRIWNAEFHSNVIKFKAGKLDLSGRSYRNLCNNYGQGINILAPFKAKKINLSGTLFFEFAQLRGLNVGTLDITGCTVNNINRFRAKVLRNSGVKTVICDSQLLGADELTLLKRLFKVVEASPYTSR